MSGPEIFVLVILLIPLYGALIWAYIDPKGSLLFGKRWMYKEEPELSDDAINFCKKSSLVAMIILTLLIILSIIR